MIGIPTDDRHMKLVRTDPVGFALLIQIRKMFMPYRPFTLPQSRSNEFGLSQKTFGKKMQMLVNSAFLNLLHRGGRYSTSYAKNNGINGGHGDASVYMLPMP